MANSSCRLLIPGSSTDPCIQLLWCHGVGTRSGIGALDFLEHRSSLRSGVDHLVQTTPLHVSILSGPSVVLPLPLLPTPPLWQNSLQISWSNTTSTPTGVTPSRARITKRLGWSKAMSALSLLPVRFFTLYQGSHKLQ